ncbi:MAG: hypothetical protein Q9170_001611 [Blastenia crenularia]
MLVPLGKTFAHSILSERLPNVPDFMDGVQTDHFDQEMKAEVSKVEIARLFATKKPKKRSKKKPKKLKFSKLEAGKDNQTGLPDSQKKTHDDDCGLLVSFPFPYQGPYSRYKKCDEK